MDFVCGIDPGLDGGLVVLDSRGELISKKVLPTMNETKGKRILDLRALREIFSLSGYLYFFLEKVSAMPGQGVSSMFKMGRGFGNLEAMLVAYELPYELVTPQAWTKVMHKGMDKKMKAKERSLLVLKRSYPNIDLTPTERAKKPHEGLMDALLIAEYGRRELILRGVMNGRGEGQGIVSSGHNASNDGAKDGGNGSDGGGAASLL